MSTARATMDSQFLRHRLRSEFDRPDYIRRPLKRPQTALVNDVVYRPSSRATSEPLEVNKKQILDSAPTYQEKPVVQQNFSAEQVQAPTVQVSKKGKIRSKLQTIKQNKLHTTLVSLAIIMAISGAYITIQGFRTNHVAAVQAAKLTAEANKPSSGGASPALSTVKPSAADLANYVVAPNLPRYITIPKLGVFARVLQVGVDSHGALATPKNVFDTAWYNESASPGQPGAMLIDGHVSSWTTQGVFYGIKKLVAGDTIKIQRGDGAIFTYKVVKNEVFASNNVDMTSAMTPVVAGKPGLNLITCTGDVIPGTSEFNQRIVVYAALSS
jgi:sortase (surface protein transpeptidase)